jgi:hypothetical protein
MKRPMRLLGLSHIIFWAIFPAFLFGETVVFEQTTGEERVLYEDTRTKTPGGFRITVTSPGEYNECELGSDYSVLTWRLKRPADGVDVVFERNGNRIYSGGTVNGEEFSKRYKVGDEPWYQFHELCLDGFGTSNAETTKFWTIDRRDMRMVKFKAEKITTETVEAAGEEWEAVRVEVSLTGLASLLRWSSTVWLRESDGRYLRLEAPGITSSDEDSVVRLVEESF